MRRIAGVITLDLLVPAGSIAQRVLPGTLTAKGRSLMFRHRGDRVGASGYAPRMEAA